MRPLWGFSGRRRIHASLFNAFTGEFIDRQSIWIKEGGIAYAGPDPHPGPGEKSEFIDAGGMVLLSGLVEVHTHFVAAGNGTREFARHLFPGGVTTVITEAVEFCEFVGKEGLDCVLKGLSPRPIRMYCAFPPMCGLAPPEDIYALHGADLAPRLDDPLCLGIGEIYWGNLLLEGCLGDRLGGFVSLALEKGKVVEGHTAGASVEKLQA